MSREIKFRIWSTENRRYERERLPNNVLKFGFDLFELEFFLDEDERDNYIFEQYTGIKDKNGKEIYEGDIVRYSFTNPNRTYTEPVSFGSIQDGEGYYHQEFLAWRTTYVDDGEAHSSLLDLVEPNWTCEVIGNIHENKELLNGSN